MIASLPGFGVGWLLKWAFAGPPPETEPESEAEELAPPASLDRSPHPISATLPPLPVDTLHQGPANLA